MSVMLSDGRQVVSGSRGGTGGGGSGVGRRVAVVAAAVGAAFVPAGAAHAVIDVGNATFDNSCANHQAHAQTKGATVAGRGIGSGNHAALPMGLPRNQCGNSGITCEGARIMNDIVQAVSEENPIALFDEAGEVIG